jgi:beta-galactosidase
MSNADRVRLLLNGRLLGEQAVDRIAGNGWTVPYAAGRIEALALRGGQIVARAAHETAGRPVALRLTPARTILAGDGEDVQPLTVDAIDARGRHVPDANLLAHFEIEGGTIIGVGNGDPNCHESEKAPQRSLFNGLAQLIVQAGMGRCPIVVRARAEGLRTARIVIDRIAVAPRPQVAVALPLAPVGGWRRSPAFPDRPSPDLAPADADNNSWAFIAPGSATPPDTQAAWRLYRAHLQPKARTARRGGTIRFAGVAGRAELWIDGRQVASKPDPAAAPIAADIAPGEDPHAIAVLVWSEPGQPSGLVGSVTVVDR